MGDFLNSQSLEDALVILGEILADRGHYFEIVAIGGGSLLLLRQIERTTKDLDLVAFVKDGELINTKLLPDSFLQAVEAVGNALELRNDWINMGPAALLDMGLPEGFIKRMHTRTYKGLTVHLAHRFDQICFKLYATVDHGPKSKHFSDLITLKPSKDELIQAKNWCMTHDVSEAFEAEINKVTENIDELS